MKPLLIFSIVLILSFSIINISAIPFPSPEVSVGIGIQESTDSGVQVFVPEPAIFNNDTLNVNHATTAGIADCWSTLEGVKCDVDDILHSDLDNLNWFDSGHTMDTDLDMNGNDIKEINDLWVENDADFGDDVEIHGSTWIDEILNVTGKTYLYDDLNVEGSVNATNYYGSGADLTNLNVTGFINVSGDFTGYALNTSFLYGALGIGGIDMRGDPWWFSGADFQIAENLIVDGNVSALWFNGKFNWTTGDNWNIFDGSTLTFNDSKLATTFYNASQIATITGTPAGTLGDIQTYNNVAYNVSEDASDLELRVNFTVGVEGEFNQLIIRYRSTEEDLAHTMIVEIYEPDEDEWEEYGTLPGSAVYHVVQFGVFDSDEHVDANGIVQVRMFQDEGVPPRTHNHEFDWVTISKGFGTPAGQEVDPDFNSWLMNPILNFSLRANDVNSTWDVIWANFLGNITNRITKLWVQDIDANGTINANNGNFSELNSTNIFTSSLNSTDNTDIEVYHNLSFFNNAWIVNVSGLSLMGGLILDKGEITLVGNDDISTAVLSVIGGTSIEDTSGSGILIQSGKSGASSIEGSPTNHAGTIDILGVSSGNGITSANAGRASIINIMGADGGIGGTQEAPGTAGDGGAGSIVNICGGDGGVAGAGTGGIKGDNGYVWVGCSGSNGFVAIGNENDLLDTPAVFDTYPIIIDGKTLLNEFIFEDNDIQELAGEQISIGGGAWVLDYGSVEDVTTMFMGDTSWAYDGNTGTVTFNSDAAGFFNFTQGGADSGDIEVGDLLYDTLTAKSPHFFSADDEVNYTRFCVQDVLGFYDMLYWSNGTEIIEKNNKRCNDKATETQSRKDCINSTHSYSKEQGCYYDEEKIIRSCLRKSYNYWDGSCKINPYRKCSINNTADWNYETSECEINPVRVCMQDNTKIWDGENCVVSDRKVCNNDRSKFWNKETETCVSVNSLG